MLGEDCYINENYDYTILWNTIILAMSYVELFKAWLQGLNLFLLLMHIPIFKQVHVTYTYIFTVLYFKSVIYAYPIADRRAQWNNCLTRLQSKQPQLLWNNHTTSPGTMYNTINIIRTIIWETYMPQLCLGLPHLPQISHAWC